MVANALRIRAATAVEGSNAEHPRVIESELLEGAAEVVPVDDDEEQRAIQKLSVLDAALRTLRIVALPDHGVKRQPKAGGGSTRALVSGARKTSAPKAARAVAVERAGPADTYERKLIAASAEFKGSDGRQHFKERLARNLERQGVKVSPHTLRVSCLRRGSAPDRIARLRPLLWT